MNGNLAARPLQDESASIATRAIEPPGHANNGRSTRKMSRQPFMEPNVPQPEPPRPVEVIDAKLGENDLKLLITVSVHGRTKRVIEDCEFGATIYEGLRPERRARLFQSFERVLEEMRDAIAIKINTTVPMEAPASASKPHANGFAKAGIFCTEQPDGGELPEWLKIHPLPDLNAT